MGFQHIWNSLEKCKCQGVWFIKVLSGSEDHITKFEEQHLSVGKEWPAPIKSDKAEWGGGVGGAGADLNIWLWQYLWIQVQVKMKIELQTQIQIQV